MSAASPPLRKWALYGIVIVSLIAVAICGLMTWHHEVQLYGDAAVQGELIGCTTTDSVDCDLVNTSEFSELFGVPIATWGIANYLLVAMMAGLALSGRTAFLPIILVVGLGNLGYSGLLFWVSKKLLGSLCAWCLRLYAINLVIPLLALLAGGHRAGLPDRRSGLEAVVFMGLLCLLAVLGQRQMRQQLLGDAAEIDLSKPVQTDVEPEILDPEGELAARQIEVTTEDGNKAMIEIGPDDHWRGNPEAEVVVIEFADLQCGYCKRAAGQLHTLYEIYADRALFVFKHFPMDPTCNPGVQNRKHRYACLAAQAAGCAHEQRRFWRFHDVTFKNQHKLKAENLRAYADKVGMDMAAFDACLDSGRTRARVMADATQGKTAEVHGTPRIFIGGRLYRSGHSTQQLARALEIALGSTSQDAAQAAANVESQRRPVKAIAADITEMQKLSYGDLDYEIDTFEAGLAEGRATSGKHQIPASQMSWFAARDACEAAGKRLCTQAEWVAACQGAPAIDDDGNGFFGDDMIEGTAYPYGDYHEKGRCWDGRDRETHRPVYTGEMPGCTGRNQVYDLTGNIEEWVGATPELAVLMGGAYDTSKDHARCFRSNNTFGPGYANLRTGFRCCR